MVRASAAGLGGLFSLLLLLCPAEAFYIPGWSIRSYREGDYVPLLVNKIFSDNTQLQYAYYELPFVCPPTGRHKAAGGLLSGQSIPLNLGEVLRGDRIVASDMELAMAKDNPCTPLCTRELSRADVERTRDLVGQGYVMEWIVDNLPGATSFVTTDRTRKYYAAGFKLGYTQASPTTGERHYFLHNHHTIVIRYRKAPGRAGERGAKAIVGFEVYPKSIGNGNPRDASGCPADLQHVKGGFELRMGSNRTGAAGARPTDSPPAAPDEGSGDEGSLSIPYTYSVYFREDDSIEWSHRWDLYFVNQDEGSRVHWLAIVNSLIICALLTGIVTLMLAKTIRADLRGYRELAGDEGKARTRRRRRRGTRMAGEKPAGLLDQGPDAGEGGDGSGGDDDDDDDDEALEDVTGWKLLHADVFRRPRLGWLLAPLVGSGMQLLLMAAGLVVLSALGVLNPSFRGGFASVGVGLFVGAGLVSGYLSARVLRSMDGRDGRDGRCNAVLTAVLVPGLAFGLVLVLNLFAWAQASSTALPLGTLAALVALWLCVQLPLVGAGAHYGSARAGPWEHPTRTAAVARPVPRQPWYARPAPAVLLAGLVPFAVVLVELLFVLQALWRDKSGYYSVFGFLAAVSLLLLVTVAEVTVLATYTQLCAENHGWWWRAFFVGGGSAVWVFGYCLWYYLFKLHVRGLVSSLLFFAYSLMACAAYGLLTGAVGFLSAYAFVRRIYGAIKVD